MSEEINLSSVASVSVQAVSVQTMAEALKEGMFKGIPKVGEVVEGVVIQLTRGLLRLDIPGVKTGVIRGSEFFNTPECEQLKIGDLVQATVVDLDNEKGELELSLRMRSGALTLDKFNEYKRDKTPIEVKIVGANRGGLLVAYQNVHGFMPVSQLSLEHYPTVSDGDREKILAKLQAFVGQSFSVAVLDFNPDQGTFIASERAARGEDQKTLLNKYQLGQILDVTVVKLIEAGVFVELEKGLTGFIHISELAWHYLPHPSSVVSVGQKFPAKIIAVEGEKVFLSRRKLLEDPWKNAETKYAVGQKTPGKVLKITPFGLFVEVDPEIHGLAHMSEISLDGKASPSEVAKLGDVLEFTIITLEPKEHRLGLSLKKQIVKETTVPETPHQNPETVSLPSP